MIFGRLPATKWDLNFQILRIPFRISPWFWLGAALLCSNVVRNDLALLLLAVLCVFVIFFVHELGHALVFQGFRAYPVVEMGFLYGVTIPDRNLRDTRQRIQTILAGPLLGLIFAGVIYFSDQGFHWRRNGTFANLAYEILFYGSLLLNLFNLLVPVYPFDGGQIVMEILRSQRGIRGIKECHILSIVVSVAYAIYAAGVEVKLIPLVEYGDFFLPAGMFAILFFVFLAAENYRYLQSMGRRRFFNHE